MLIRSLMNSICTAVRDPGDFSSPMLSPAPYFHIRSRTAVLPPVVRLPIADRERLPGTPGSRRGQMHQGTVANGLCVCSGPGVRWSPVSGKRSGLISVTLIECFCTMPERVNRGL